MSKDRIQQRESVFRLLPQMKGHERREVLRGEWRWHRDSDFDRVPIVTDVEKDRRRLNPKVSRQLSEAGSDRIGSDDQVIEQRIRAERRPTRNLQRQVRRKPSRLCTSDQCTKSLARQSYVRVLEIRPGESGGGD